MPAIVTMGVVTLLILTNISRVRFGAPVTYDDWQAIVWEPVLEISNDSSSDNQWLPVVAADGDKAHVVWYEAPPGDYDVVYRLFDGTSWGAQWEVSPDVGNEQQFNPSIAVYKNKRHIVWYEWPGLAGSWPDVYHKYYDGSTWRNDGPVAVDVGTMFDRSPSVAAYENKAHIVWQDYTDGDADMYYSYFNGIDWGSTQELSTDVGTEAQGFSSIAVDGDRVHVVWGDGGDGDSDIYYRYYNGTSWQPELEISSDTAMEVQYNPSIAVDDGNIYVVWEDYGDGDADIFLRHFNGTEWQSEIEISEDLGSENQDHPRVAADAGKVHVVWQNHLADIDIYYRRGVQDLAFPDSKADRISPYWLTNSTFDVGWSATDDYNLANVSLEYRFSPDNSSWSSWKEWAYNNSISGASATGSFSFYADSDGYYEFYTIASDIVGNEESPPIVPDAIVGIATIPRPPTNLSAWLVGLNAEHVWIEWDPSPDETGGRKNVVAYQIFKGTLFNASGVGYAPQGLHLAPYEWDLDSWAGEGDPNDYFYFVCVYTNFLKSSCTTNQVAKFTRPLSLGINLISIPLIQSDESIQKVLQTVEFDKAWTYDAPDQPYPWKSYTKSKPYGGELNTLNHRMGIWINVTMQSNLTVAGIVPWTTSIPLQSGWNLVGFPSFLTNYVVLDIRMDTGSVMRVEGFSGISPPYFLKVLQDGDFIESGYGYWVWSVTDVIWIVNVS